MEGTDDCRQGGKGAEAMVEAAGMAVVLKQQAGV
jgi:hypothetical protein